MIIPVVSVTAVADSGPQLKIELIKAGWANRYAPEGSLQGSVIATVFRNIGDTDATDVNWNISMTGGIFNHIHIVAGGTVATLTPNNPQGIQIKGPSFVFGIVNMTVTVSVSNGDTVTKSINGFGLFFFVEGYYENY